MLTELTYSRPDGTFVGIVNGLPYHVTQDTPYWAEAQALAADAMPPAEPGPAPAVPYVISDRQFFQMLALAGTITQAEALDAVKVGAIPPTLAAFVAAIPDDGQRFAAEMLLSGATEFRRDHPLVNAVGAAQGMSPADIDAFWMAANTL